MQLILSDWERFILAALLLGLYLWGGHYFKWPALLRKMPITLILRYVYGVAGIIAAYAILVWDTDLFDSVLTLLLLSVIGGIVVVTCYAYDYLFTTNDREHRRNRNDTDGWRNDELNNK